MSVGPHGPKIVIALVLWGTAGQTQDATAFDQTWQYFLDRCGLAHSDPLQYFDGLIAGLAPYPGNVSTSSDGSIVWGGTTGTVLHDTYTVSSIGDYQKQDCYVMGWFDGSPTPSADLNADFLEYVKSRSELVVSGGQTEEGAGLNGFGSKTYRYAVLGALPEEIVVRVYIGEQVVEIFSSHVAGGK